MSPWGHRMDCRTRLNGTDLDVASDSGCPAGSRYLWRAAADHVAERERIAGLTGEAARAEVLAAAGTESRRAAALLARDIERRARREAERTARMIVTTSIQRVAAEQAAESVVSTLHLPAGDMKGRIIGR